MLAKEGFSAGVRGARQARRNNRGRKPQKKSATAGRAAASWRQLGSCCVVVPGPDVSGNVDLGDTRSASGRSAFPGR
jgi:hypothetical protein